MFRKELIPIVFFGSIWGFLETTGGSALYNANVPYSDIILSIIAIGILGISFIFVSRPGSITLIAVTACLFRLINAGPYYCHLLAILSLGLGFDIIAKLIKREKPIWISGALGTWLGYVIFVFSITYLFRYHYWTYGGFAKVLKYIGLNGSLAALGAAITSLFGYNFGKVLYRAFKKKERLAYSIEIAIIFIIWIFIKVI